MMLLTFLTITCTVLIAGSPSFKSPEHITLANPHNISEITAEMLVHHHLEHYNERRATLDFNIALQAGTIVAAVLLIIRRSDTLRFFENSIPLSWLHFFTAALLLYLWLSFSFLLHVLIEERINSINLIRMLGDNNLIVNSEIQVFRDASLLDGWFITFVDPLSSLPYSGTSPRFTTSTAGFLILLLGTLVATAHGTLFAIVSIGCRRYLNAMRQPLYCYYLIPILPLAVVLVSHIQFAYGGENPNWLQLYIAILTWPIVGFFLWLSFVVDARAHTECIQCLGRQRTRLYTHSRFHTSSEWHHAEEAKMISLIGDSLSTSFYVGWPPAMLFRMWRRWKPNWFLGLSQHGRACSVLGRLGRSFSIKGVQHASVSAKVDQGGPRSFGNRLTDTWHFSHQVTEVLSRQLPHILLVWIGHNNLDWKRDHKPGVCDQLEPMVDEFGNNFEKHIRRILRQAKYTETPLRLVVFGLVNFEAFFNARSQAEDLKSWHSWRFPYLRRCYQYFVSMRPELRNKMITLANLYNDRLRALCINLSSEYEGGGVAISYSDAFTVAKLDHESFLSPVDTWHPSNAGHALLADAAYSTVEDAIRFVLWHDGGSSATEADKAGSGAGSPSAWASAKDRFPPD